MGEMGRIAQGIEGDVEQGPLSGSLVHGDLTNRIIGAAIQVHRELGPGFLESIYERALGIELNHREIPFERQLEIPIKYREIEVGKHRLDLLVADEIIVELKAVADLENIHFVIVRSYLCAARKRHALLLNFAQSTLLVKRVQTKI